MSYTVYYIITSVLVCGIILGIALMNRVKTARIGNLISSLTALFAILLVLYKNQLIGDTGIMIALASGAAAGIIFTLKVKMVEMPQAVALLNGFGGFSSMLIAIIIITDKVKLTNIFSLLMAFIALAVGSITFSGSMVAAGKLQKLLPQKSVRFKGQIFATNFILVLTICLIVSICILAYTFGDRADEAVTAFAWACLSLTLILGVIFSIRIGGADMPITISLLNSLSGVAGGIAGIAIGDPLLCAAGGIVGASGIILTQTMCKSMNRSLLNILLGGGISATGCADCSEPINKEENPSEKSEKTPLKSAQDIIIGPGYGMALAHAQM
ncbi:MAG: NAD(P)(+) transhydrogenase (Re/Si-specific) subunit beta, partial [Clostridiales bacterium]|nr:NAD(P)(+) transhydrogenase (Re/Si-specific) subunit beta [Clostridiales bacterium]